MAGEIFISYRRADEAWARLFHNQLKAEGVEAWYDARVGAGQDWRAATATALSNARIFVLLFSKAASESDDIAKELAAATFSKKLVVPIRIENIQPEGAFLYELASRNWVDAFENTEAKFAELARSLAKLVKTGDADENIIPFDRSDGSRHIPAPPWKLKRKPAIIAAASAIVVAVAVVAFLGVGRFLHQGSVHPVKQVAAMQPPAGISVAVLPFLNLSSDKEQDYFSDGMTEEITSALVNVKGLRVIARTSAFTFKGKNEDVRAIGQALSATDVIEGSVRKEGNRVRITAQLIRSDTGDHLWTDSYDRELKDVFAVQEEIARAIAAALQVPLGLNKVENLVSNRTGNTAVYQDYLRAIAAYKQEYSNQAIDILESVVARDPGYAPAWALLAAYYPSENRDLALPKSPTREDLLRALRVSEPLKREKAIAAAQNALRLDPRSALAYAALGYSETQLNHWAAAHDDFEKALALDPTDPMILDEYWTQLLQEGRLRQALKVESRLQQDEPLVPAYQWGVGYTLLLMGDTKRAVPMLEQRPGAFRLARTLPHNILAFAYASSGQYQRAAETIQSLDPSLLHWLPAEISAAANIIRTAPAKSTISLSYNSHLVWVYLFVGEPQRFIDALDFQGTAIAPNYPSIEFLWHPAMAGARKTQQFKQLVRKWGLVDYWRTKGWPDLCHPVGSDDFACD